MDTGLPIAAWRGTPEATRKALDVFGDPSLTLVGSPYLRLELPGERALIERLLSVIEVWATTDDARVARAGGLRTAFDLAPMDASHVASAERAGTERLLTIEKLGKPIHRVSAVGRFTCSILSDPPFGLRLAKSSRA